MRNEDRLERVQVVPKIHSRGRLRYGAVFGEATAFLYEASPAASPVRISPEQLDLEALRFLGFFSRGSLQGSDVRERDPLRSNSNRIVSERSTALGDDRSQPSVQTS